MTIKFAQESLEIYTWVKKMQYSAFCQALGSGVYQHLQVGSITKLSYCHLYRAVCKTFRTCKNLLFFPSDSGKCCSFPLQRETKTCSLASSV